MVIRHLAQRVEQFDALVVLVVIGVELTVRFASLERIELVVAPFRRVSFELAPFGRRPLLIRLPLNRGTGRATAWW